MYLHLTNWTLDQLPTDRRFDDPVGRAQELSAVMRLLPEPDRRLVDLVILQHRSHRDAAVALGLDAGVVCRRARRLRNRLACPTFRVIARALDTLDPAARALAVDHFILDLPVNVCARERGLPRKVVQSQVDFLRGWAKGTHRAALRAQNASRDVIDDRIDARERAAV